MGGGASCGSSRLAPLPGAENNNKPGVKLPASLDLDGVATPLTILEAVLKQTGASSRVEESPCPPPPSTDHGFFVKQSLSPLWTKSLIVVVVVALVVGLGVYAPNRKGRLSVFWGDQVSGAGRNG